MSQGPSNRAQTLPRGWERVSDYCIRSTDGRFTVCKYGVADNTYRYETWDRKDQIASGMSTAAEAIRASERRATTSSSSAQAAGPKFSPSQDGAPAAQLSFIEAD